MIRIQGIPRAAQDNLPELIRRITETVEKGIGLDPRTEWLMIKT